MSWARSLAPLRAHSPRLGAAVFKWQWKQAAALASVESRTVVKEAQRDISVCLQSPLLLCQLSLAVDIWHLVGLCGMKSIRLLLLDGSVIGSE